MTYDQSKEWILKNVYDDSKGECEEGLSCSVFIDYTGYGTDGFVVPTSLSDGVQTCQKCNYSWTNTTIENLQGYDHTEQEKIDMENGIFTNVYKDESIVGGYPYAADGLVFYICYSDVHASRIVLAAGTLIFSAISAMF